MRSYPQHLRRSMGRPDLAFEGTLMNEFIYRPSELLVHKGDYGADVQRELANWGAEETALPEGLGLPDDYPIIPFVLPPQMSVPQVVARLHQVVDGAEPRIAPNYVFGAEQSRMPAPARPARPGSRALDANHAEAGGFTVGVVDTGIVVEGDGPHRYLDGHVSFEASDRDPIDVNDDGWLDVYDGHGTFVAGRILEQAPGATVRAYRGLDTGVSDDLAIAAAIRRLGRDGVKLINLSFSSTADGATYPLAVSEELAELEPDVVVVAAAGNYGRRRPFWPAAFKRVIAIGAVDETDPEMYVDGMPPRAVWSNFGWWVDACAGGEYVLGPFCTFDETERHAGEDGADTFTGWAEWSGTSFAAPKVTGRIARIAMDEGISPRQAADRVVRDPDLPQIRGLGTYVS